MIADITNTTTPTAQAFADTDAIIAWRERGDEEAAAWLIRQYRAFVRAIALRKLSTVWLAEDAVQDSFSRAFTMLARYDIARPFSAWLARITSNVCFDKLRALTRRNEVAIEDIEADFFEAQALSNAHSTAHPIHILETRHILHALIATLRVSDREIIELRYLHGLSTRAVAERTGLGLSAVALRAMRARNTLIARARELRATDDLAMS